MKVPLPAATKVGTKQFQRCWNGDKSWNRCILIRFKIPTTWSLWFVLVGQADFWIIVLLAVEGNLLGQPSIQDLPGNSGLGVLNPLLAIQGVNGEVEEVGAIKVPTIAAQGTLDSHVQHLARKTQWFWTGSYEQKRSGQLPKVQSSFTNPNQDRRKCCQINSWHAGR